MSWLPAGSRPGWSAQPSDEMPSAAACLRVIDVRPVDADLFGAAMATYRASAAEGVSLVDHSSFALMRSLGIGRAFAYDDDFTREGFELVA